MYVYIEGHGDSKERGYKRGRLGSTRVPQMRPCYTSGNYALICGRIRSESCFEKLIPM